MQAILPSNHLAHPLSKRPHGGREKALVRIEQCDGYRGRLPVRQHFHQSPLLQVVSNDILRQLRQPKSCQAHFYIEPRFIHRGVAADGYRKHQANVPQLDVQVDRDKAKAQGVSLTELFGTLQTYLGSSYVNDFNQFGRTWRVMAQADGPYRESVEDIANLRTRNNQGEMVPIGSMVNISTTYGPDPVIRYNGYPAADLIGDADPRVLSSSQAMTHLEELSKQILPNGMNIEWTDLSFQQATQGNTALIVFPVAVLLAFLVLAALYESWTLPLAVILIVPMTMLSALFGVWLTGGDNNVFVQVGLVVLMGLACKNAILIVEFARELEIQGKGIMEAALEACRLRLRPIVMTSIAFIAGTIPLILGHGAGAEVRGVTGITVFSGMLGVTLFGLFLTPVFYVTLRKLVTRRKPVQEDLPA